MRCSRRWTLCVVGTLGVAVSAWAQSAPRTPNLLGIYTGMPAAEARAALQKHSGEVNVQMMSQPAAGFGMHITDSANPDEINVYLTDAPDEPHVWMVQRTQTYSESRGTPMALDTVMGALREKYGRETLTMDRGGGGLYVFWLFDANGKLLATGDPAMEGCDGNQIVTYMSLGVPKGAAQVNAVCYQGFFAVKAMFNRAAPPLLNAYSVELVNLPLAYRAAVATGAARNGVAAKAAQDAVDAAKKNQPKF